MSDSVHQKYCARCNDTGVIRELDGPAPGDRPCPFGHEPWHRSASAVEQTRRDYDPMLGWIGVSSADLAAAAGEVAAQDFARRLDDELAEVTKRERREAVRLVGAEVLRPVPGETVVVTIDRDINSLADDQRGDMVERLKAIWPESVVVVVDRSIEIAVEADAPNDLTHARALRCRTAALLLEDLAASLRARSGGGS